MIVVDAGVTDVVVDGATVDAVENDAGIVEEEIQIDPAVAEDPDVNAGSAAPPEDEEPDAPKSEEEIEKREAPPPAPQLARNVHDAVVMIKQGKKTGKGLALAAIITGALGIALSILVVVLYATGAIDFTGYSDFS